MTPRPSPWSARAPRLALLLVVLVALVPFHVVSAHPLTTLLGTSNDNVHGVWSLWYLAQGVPTDALWPAGVEGSVVGGPSILFARGVTALVGAAAAWSAANALQTVLALVGVGALAVRLGGGPWSAPAAALLLLCGRPLLAHVALGVPEGAAIGWFSFALVVGLGPVAGAGRRATVLSGLLCGALLGASLVENPYTVPLVGLAALGLTWARVRARAWPRLLGEGIGGAAVLGVWLLLVVGEGGGLDAAAVGRSVKVLGAIYVAEGYDGRAHLEGLLRPWPLPKYAGARLTHLLGSGAADYLGWMPVILAAAAGVLRVPRARACLLAAAGLLLLAFGSFPFGDEARIPGPFLYFNLVLGWIVRPLTQPVRYLVPVGAALAVAGALLVGEVLRRTGGRAGARLVILLCVATIEALLVGSPSTHIPTFDLSTWACVDGLGPGPVATGARRTAFENPGAAALALQLVHDRPGTHAAIGGWRLRAPRTAALEAALVELETSARVNADLLRRLRAEGVRWVVTDPGSGIAGGQACGGVEVLDLAQVAGR